VVPAVLSVELVLARTSQRVIGLTGIRVYPNGFGFPLHIRIRELIPGEQTNFGMLGGDIDPSGEFADYCWQPDHDDPVDMLGRVSVGARAVGRTGLAAGALGSGREVVFGERGSLAFGRSP
jgi:hypothetical protein